MDKLKTYTQLQQRYGKQFPDSKEPAAPFNLEEMRSSLGLKEKENVKVEQVREFISRQETTIF